METTALTFAEPLWLLALIVIPIFARSPVFYRIIARLRYRIANGKPVFWYEMWRPDLTFETAFNEAVADVGEKTGLPIYLGLPEA